MVVSHVWLIKAIGITILAALVCGYITLCLLFYQGQWQLVLHPHRATSNPQTTETSSIHFGPDESAIPQLAGKWLPAAPGARYANTTILFLPSGEGSLADFNSTLDHLHNIGINVFAFDYRGYGFSADTHPSQQKMIQDADSAWTYLNTSRAIPSHQIIPYGTGVGASFATHLALSHSDIQAIILESPKGDLLDAVLRDPRVALLPARLLFNQDFPLAKPLATLRTPKLLLTTSASPEKAFQTAADPKLTVQFASLSDALYTQTLTRFLDQYVPASPARELVPFPAPVR
jgi:pimeloyl-ACP methyl ester carboxylesterase